jgi:uncharacterized membrane protein
MLSSPPADLSLLVGLVLVTWGSVLLPVLDTTPLRVFFGPLLVLFAPGYALLAALYPGRDSRQVLSGVEGPYRVSLAVATSIALTACVGIGLTVTPWGFTAVSTALTLGSLTLVFCLIALVRRDGRPSDDRVSVPVRSMASALLASLVDPPARVRLVNVLVVFSVLLVAGSVAYAAAVPHQGTPFSELYVLSVDGNDATDVSTQGYYVAPTSNATVRVGVSNHERTTVRYTLVAGVIRVGDEDTFEVTDRFGFTLDHGQVWERQQVVSPELGDLRVVYLLYRGAPPDQPVEANAYRYVSIQVDTDSAIG